MNLSLIIMLLIWIFVSIVGVFINFPNTDDIFYALPSLNYALNNSMGVPFTDNYNWPIYFNFPTFSFLMSFVFKAYNLFSIPIQFETYRFFQIFIFLGIILFSYFLVKKEINSKNIFSSVAPIFFIGLIGVFPIAQTFLLFRPETLGIFLIIFSLWLIYKPSYDISGKLKIIFASFLIGITPSLHPIFAFISFSIILYYLYKFIKNKEFILFILVAFFSSISLVILLTYLLLINPENFTVLKEQSIHGSLVHQKAFLALFPRSFGLLYNGFTSINMIQTFFYLPTLVLISFFVYKFLKFLTQFFLKSQKININIFDIIIISSFVTYFYFYDTIYVHSTLSFLILISFFCSYYQSFLSLIENKYIILSKFIIILSLLAPFSWLSMNIAKYYFFDDKYILPTSVTKTIRSELSTNIPLFVTRPEMASLIISKLLNPINNSTFWLFPSHGQVYLSKEDYLKIINFLNNYAKGTESFWLIKYDQLLGSKKTCLKLNHQYNNTIHKSIKVYLNNPKIYLTFSDYYLLKTNDVRIGCESMKSIN